jgi:hypothetical protein
MGSQGDLRPLALEVRPQRGFVVLNPSMDCSKTVPKPNHLSSFGLALSEKQIPQIVENNESRTDRMERLEAAGVRPRQVRSQAALRPDWDDCKRWQRVTFATLPKGGLSVQGALGL